MNGIAQGSAGNGKRDNEGAGMMSQNNLKITATDKRLLLDAYFHNNKDGRISSFVMSWSRVKRLIKLGLIVEADAKIPPYWIGCYITPLGIDTIADMVKLRDEDNARRKAARAALSEI